MKNIKFLFIFSIFAALISCEPEYEHLNEYSAVDWYTTAFGGEAKVAIGKYMSFSDLSQQTVSHSWSISDTSDNKFLKGSITTQDKTYEEFIDNSIDTISSDRTVHILFTEGGKHGVRLINSFKDEVAFNGNDTINAVYEDGYWVIDTTFIVDVYDSIQPAFKVYQDDIEIISIPYDSIPKQEDKDLWTEVEVVFGTSLTFVDLTVKGRPDAYSWEINNATPEVSTDSASVVAFNQIGTFTGKYVASRSDEEIAASKTKLIPLKINVVPSSEPLVFQSSEKTGDDMLVVQTSGGLQDFEGLEGDFVVHVTNTNGFDANIPVTLAAVNSSDVTQINLTLDAAIYNNDVITVTYNGTGIQSLDSRTLGTFSNGSVDIVVGSYFDIPEYTFSPDYPWSIDKDTSFLSHVTKDGNTCIYVTADATKPTLYPTPHDDMGLVMMDGEEFRLEYDVFYVGAVPAKMGYKFVGSLSQGSPATNNSAQAGIVADSWYHVTQKIQFGKNLGSVSKFGFRSLNPAEFYIANVQLIRVSVRP